MATLADDVYDRVERMIVTLELEPGAVFSESGLSERIGIGRTPVREALQRLASGRLVTIVPRQGIRVTDIDVLEYLALLETRAALDGVLVMRAARRASPAQRSRLNELAAHMQSAATEADVESFMRLDREADAILDEAADNPFASEALRPLHAHCRRFWYRYKHAGDLPRSAVLHARLLLSVAQGDDAEAAAASDALIGYLVSFTRAAMGL